MFRFDFTRAVLTHFAMARPHPSRDSAGAEKAPTGPRPSVADAVLEPTLRGNAAWWERWRTVIMVALVSIAVGGVAVLSVWWIERASLNAAQKGFTSIPAGSEPLWSKFSMKSIFSPPTFPAGTAEVADTDEIIGVVANGKARAYTIEALSDRRQHIVNDVIGNVPVSVAYCDLKQCVRAYTSGGQSQPLEVEHGGYWRGEGMIVKVKGVYYFQETGNPMEPGHGIPALPYDDYPRTRTTWKEWKRQHPGTDVYIGESWKRQTSKKGNAGR